MQRTAETEEAWDRVEAGSVVMVRDYEELLVAYHGPRGGKWIYTSTGGWHIERDNEGRILRGWNWRRMPFPMDFVVIATGVADTASDDEFKRICGGHDEAV